MVGHNIIVFVVCRDARSGGSAAFCSSVRLVEVALSRKVAVNKK